MATNLVKVEWNTKEKTKFFVWIPETHPKFATKVKFGKSSEAQNKF